MELASLGGKAVAGDLKARCREVARHRPAADALLAAGGEHGVHILAARGPVFTGDRPVNRATFFGPGGVIGHQDKQIMTRFEREDWDVVPGGPGSRFSTPPLGRMGVVICYDSEFPLLARPGRRRGRDPARPVCTETWAGFNRVRIGAMARALENQCVAVHAPLVGSRPLVRGLRGEYRRAPASTARPTAAGRPGHLAEGSAERPGWTYATISRRRSPRCAPMGASSTIATGRTGRPARPPAP
jgi:predicted amidohydrolase